MKPGAKPRQRLLIVDDDTEILDTLRDAFRYLLPHVEILTAKSGEEGLRHIKRGQIDLIITDFKMPGMDGLQFLDYAAPLVPKARAIMISAFRAPALVGRQAPLPVVAFMEKPFDVARLVETVNQHLAAPA